MAPVVTPPRDLHAHDAVTRLFERYRERGEEADRDALVTRFLPLARSLSRRYAHGGEREDVEQVAALGLLKAIDRYDPSRGIAFTSFAVPTILGELKRYFRDLGWTVRVPRSLQELSARADKAVEALTIELGRTPTTNEIAERCETTVEHVLEARATASAHRAESLDRPARDEDGSTVGELVGDADPGYDRVEDAVDLERLLAQLGERERQVLELRFGHDLVQREIGERLGISQMHVSRLIRQAITALQATS
jgi:RNA polymerase sigma-B factor